MKLYQHKAFLHVVGAFALLVSSNMYAAAEDTAFISALHGQASIEGKNMRVAVPFSMVRAGEILALGKDASIQIIYFTSGRQESWSGSTRFRVGEEKSDNLVGAPAAVTKISTLISQSLIRTPQGSGSSRVGMVRLRSIDALKAKKLDEDYAQIKASQPQDSSLAEVYMLNSLLDMKAYGEIQNFLSQMNTDNPSNPDVARLSAKYMRAILEAKGDLAVSTKQ